MARSSRQPGTEGVKPSRPGFLHWAKDNGEEEDVGGRIAVAGSQHIPLATDAGEIGREALRIQPQLPRPTTVLAREFSFRPGQENGKGDPLPWRGCLTKAEGWSQ